jgi:glucose-1-phosphate cytidylyltransferase
MLNGIDTEGAAMKCVILAGGQGTRISEESHLRPKPMVEIGGRPLLWHIMKIYSQAGIDDFVICLGYKGHAIKEYFANYYLYGSDVSIDLGRNQISYLNSRTEAWRVTLVDTGEFSMTGGRLRHIRRFVEDDEAFCLTYGDGVADVDIQGEIAFHRGHGLLATMTVVQPLGRFGAANVDGDLVERFEEKPADGFINGGFFVMSPKVLDLIDHDGVSLENETLLQLVEQRQLAAWRHGGFWQAMDTMRDRGLLESLWATGAAKWKTWE